MSLIKVQDFNVATVYVDDFEEGLKFYTEVLGIEKTVPQGPGVLLNANNQLTIYLEGGRQKKSDALSQTPETCLCFWPECGVKKAYELMKEAGVTLVGEYMDCGETFHMYRCADPSGNVIEIAGKP